MPQLKDLQTPRKPITYEYLSTEETQKQLKEMAEAENDKFKKTEHCTHQKKCVQDVESRNASPKWCHMKLNEAFCPNIDKNRAWTPGYLPEQKEKTEQCTIKDKKCKKRKSQNHLRPNRRIYEEKNQRRIHAVALQISF